MAAKEAAKKKGRARSQSQLYQKDGDGVKRLNKTCPKCGPGMFLAKHKDRETCGSCGYTEFHGKK